MADPNPLRRRADAILAGEDLGFEPAGAPLPDITTPPVPPQQVPDPQGAEDQFLRAADERFSLSSPGVGASTKAVDTAKAIRARPDDVEARPSLLDQAALAFEPAQLRGDARPASAAEAAAYVARRAKSLALSAARVPVGLVDPFGINPIANQARDVLTPEDEKGLPTENQLLWGMRILGTAAPAVVQETVERLPAPDMTGMFERGASALFTPSTVGEQVLGVEPGELQRVRRTDEGFGRDWAQGVLERIEGGRGLEEEFALSAARRLGEDWRNTAWWVGLGVDALTNWEGALAKPGKIAAGVAKRTAALAELAPEMGQMERVWTALRDNEVDISGWLGPKLAKYIEDGGSIDDLPAGIRARAEEIALNMDESGLVELAELEGVGRPRTVQAEDLAGAEKLAQAEAEARAGGVPGEFAERRQVLANPEAAALAAKRQRLPAFTRKVAPSTAAEWWEQASDLFKAKDAPAEGYNLIRNEGFRRLVDAADQSPEMAEYVLRNRRGDVLGRGTFAEMTERAFRRQIDGDELWWKDQRPVARWSKVVRDGKVKWASDYLFSSPVERELIYHLRSVDPRAIPAKLKAMMSSARTEGPEARAGRLLADVLTDAPPAGRAKTRVGQIVELATGLHMRDRMGTDVFRALPNGALAPKADHPRILARTEKILPVTQARAAELIGGATPTADEAKAIGALGARYGIDLDPAQLTTRDWLDLRAAATTEAGGVFADARFRMQGTRPFVAEMMKALGDVALDRRRYTKLGEATFKRGPLSWIGPRFAEDKIGGLPPVVRTVWRKVRTALQRNADDLLQEVKAVKGESTTAGKLLAVLKRYDVVHPVDLENADFARRVLDDDDTAEVAELRDRWRGPKPSWLMASDPLIFRVGLDHHIRTLNEDAALSGRRWLLAHLQAAGQDVANNTLREAVDKLPVELGRRVYEEAFVRGDFEGPALREALHDVAADSVKLDKDGALVVYAIQTRADAIIGEAMDELLGQGVVVRQGDPRKGALHAVVMGEHKVWNPAARRWEFRFPEGQVAWALERARDMGIDPGVGSKALPENVTLGRRRVAVPKYIADDLARMIASAKLDSRGVYDVEFIDKLVRAFKEWTTHGWILPNPSHFMGQMISVLPTIYTTRGAKGLATTGLTVMRNPLIVGGLVKRLAGGEHPVFRARVPEAELLLTDNGAIYSIEDLEAAARRNGLQDTPASFETAERFKDLILRDGTEYAALDPRRLVQPLRWWQNQLRWWAGAADLTARMAVFVDLAKKGVPLDEAAQMARESLLDFRNLTDFEARRMRQFFTFYAFMRKNADAYVGALYRHPERVLSQMRLAHASIRAQGFTPLEEGAISEDDTSRLTVYNDRDVADESGRIHPLYRATRLQTVPLGVGEWMNLMRQLAFQDNPGLLSSVTPLGQTLAIWFMGRTLDREFDSPHANRIPPVLMDASFFPASLFGIGPVPLRAREDPLLADADATAELGSGVPAVWAAGGDPTLTPEQQAAARTRWQLFRAWFGRPIGTAEQFAEAAGAEASPPYVTQSEGTLATMLGFRWRPVLAEQEAVRRGLAEREARFNEATDAITVPDRSNLPVK